MLSAPRTGLGMEVVGENLCATLLAQNKECGDHAFPRDHSGKVDKTGGHECDKKRYTRHNDGKMNGKNW